MSLNSGLCLGDEDREYTSAEFCEALHAVFGDGICRYGAGFGLTLGGFDLNISTGYAAAAGRYVKNTDTFTATLGPSSNTEDRYDALAVRVDYPGRRAALEVLQNVDPEAIRANPVIVRSSTEYCVILYFIHVRRGATTLSPNDVEDVRSDSALCGNVVPLAEASGNVLYIYRYLTEGIDEKAGQLMQDSERILQKAADAVERIDAILADKGITPVVGELRTAVDKPLPEKEWLLCNGGAVPSDYIDLMILIGGSLPDIQPQDSRVHAYIYAGDSSGSIPDGMCLIFATPNDIAYGRVTGGGLARLGASVSLTAVPNEGYKFVSWQENGQVVSSDMVYTFTASENRVLTALFAVAATISLRIDPEGGGTASGGGTFDIGTSVTVTASPASGYLFVAWKEGGETVSTNRTYTFTAERSRRLTAVFAVACTVSASVDPSGSGSVSGAGTYPQGAVVTVTAAAGNGYRFAAWKENGVTVSTSASYSFAVTGNRSLTAVFVNAITASWNIANLPRSASWRDVASGGQYMAAVAAGAYGARSNYNFDNWESMNLAENAGWTRVVYYDDRYIAISRLGDVTGIFICATSTDCFVWHRNFSLPNILGDCRDIATDRFGCVAVGKGTKGAYSPKGNTEFKETAMPSAAEWSGVAAVNPEDVGVGHYAAIARGSNKAAYTTDNVNWTAASLPISADWSAIAYGGRKFIAVAKDSRTAALSADFGATWRSITLPVSAGIADIVYGDSDGDGKFVILIGNGKLLYSKDGTTWIEGPAPDGDWGRIAWAGGKFILLPSNGDTLAYGQ